MKGTWVWLLFGAVLASQKRGSAAPPAPGPPRGNSVFYRWSDEDMASFAAAVRRAGVEPALALAVYGSESRLNPGAKNPTFGAAGIPQILPSLLPLYGGDPQNFHKWSVAQQIPVIERLLKSQVATLGTPPQTASKLYHLNFYPKTAHDTVVVRATDDPRAYYANIGFDTARKGFIDEDDLRAFLQPIVDSPDFSVILEQLKRVDPGSVVGLIAAFY